jgi:hypothetical protein
MTDITQGPGAFEVPTYDDLVKQLGDSNNDKLVKVSQILAETQMTHQILNNFKGYRDTMDVLSKSIFDPVKNEMVNIGQKAGDVIGRLPSGGTSITPEEILKTVKNPSSAIKAKMTQVKQDVKSKLDDVKKTGKDVLDDFVEGEAKPQINKLVANAQELAKKANISDKIVQDFQDVVEQRFNSIPDSLKVELRNMGITDDELRSVVSNSADPNLAGLVKSKLGASSVRYDDPFTSDELDIPQEYLGKLYRANKLLSKLKEPSLDTGMLSGDSSIARAMGQTKSALKTVKGKLTSEVDQLTDSVEVKPASRLATKIKGRLSKKAQAQEQQTKPVSEIEPADDEFTIPQIIRKAPIIQEYKDIDFNTIPEIDLEGGLSKSVSDIITTDDDVTQTISKLTKAKNILSKATEDTTELDESGFGDVINAGLGIASIATLIAGLFEKPKQQTTIGDAEQLGV